MMVGDRNLPVSSAAVRAGRVQAPQGAAWAIRTIPLADPYLSTAIILAETLIFPPILLVER